MPLPALAPWRPASGTGDTASLAPILLAPPDREPTPDQPLGTLHHSGQLSPVAREISKGPSSTGASRDSRGSSRGSLPDEPSALEDDGYSLLFDVHGIYTAHADDQGAVLTSHFCLEETVFESVSHIDDVAEVV